MGKSSSTADIRSQKLRYGAGTNAVDPPNSALSAASREITAEHATAIVDAIGELQKASTGVYSTLANC